jgi:hypothetical protein
MDEDAPYIDGNRSAGTKGSIVPAAAIEHTQRELVNLINFAGLVPNAGDLEQVRKAIEALILAATGGGDTSQYLLISQARTRLPLFPEVLTADGRINVTSPGAGSVLVPEAVAFQHRGIFPVNTSDYNLGARTLATAANKTYHLRWTPGGGFVLKDLANAGYNPLAKAEISTDFDSAYDDMLVARVVTNAGNVAAITNLANLSVLRTTGEEVGAKGVLGSFVTEDGVRPSLIGQYTAVNLNFARTPDVYLTATNDYLVSAVGREFNVGARALSRYQVAVWGQGDADIWVGWAARV